MADLEIRNLHARAGEKQILRGLDLTVDKGEIHALMGPNGSGKSTLANAIMGHPGFEVTDGRIIFKGEDVTEAAPDERARMGLFMAFQYPVSVPGVTVTKYLRTVAEGVQRLHDEQGLGALIITHYQRILHYIQPHFVHIMLEGRIVLRDGPSLVERLEREGYDQIRK